MILTLFVLTKAILTCESCSGGISGCDYTEYLYTDQIIPEDVIDDAVNYAGTTVRLLYQNMYDLSYTQVHANGTSRLVGDASPMENFFLGFGKFGLSRVIRRKNSQLELPKRVTIKDKIHFVENGPHNPIVNITYKMCELKVPWVKKIKFHYADQTQQEVSSRYFKNENCTEEQSLSPPSYCFGAALTSFEFVDNQLSTTWSCGVDRYYEEVDCTNDHFQRLENTYRISISVVQSFFEDVQNSVSTWLHN